MSKNKMNEYQEIKDIYNKIKQEIGNDNKIFFYFRSKDFYYTKGMFNRLYKSLQRKNESNFKLDEFMPDTTWLLKRKEISNELKLEITDFILNNYFHNPITDFNTFFEFINLITEGFTKINSETLDFKVAFIEEIKQILNCLIEIKSSNSEYYKLSKVYTRYPLLLRKIFILTKNNVFSSNNFREYLNFYDNISYRYHSLELWKLKVDFFYDIEKSKIDTKRIIFQFLSYYKNDEYMNNSLSLSLSSIYPNPIKFCEFLEKKFPRDEILELYIEFYDLNTTDYIPPLLLKNSYLKKKTILNIITKIFLNEYLFYKDYESLFNKFINFRPKKSLFKIYTHLIASLFNQYKFFWYPKLFESSTFSLSEKFQILQQIFKSFPNSTDYPSLSYFQIFIKILIKKKRVIKSYFRYILQAKHFLEFRRFIQISNNNPKYNIDKRLVQKTSKRRIGKIRRITNNLLNKSEFFILKKLEDYITGNFFRFDREYNTLEEFALEKFGSKEPKLIWFLYFLFINKASKKRNWASVIKYYNNLDTYLSNNESNISISYLGIKKDFELEVIHFQSLINEDQEKLKKYLKEQIEIEEKSKFGNQIKSGITYLILGELDKAKQLLLKVKAEKPFKPLFGDLPNDESYYEEKMKKIDVLISVINFEIHLADFGSIEEALDELEILLGKLIKVIDSFFSYFYAIEIIIHYYNLLKLFELLEQIIYHPLNKDTRQLLKEEYLEKINYEDLYYFPYWLELVELWGKILENNSIFQNLKENSWEIYKIFNKNHFLKRIYTFIKHIIPQNSDLFKLFKKIYQNPHDIIKKIFPKYEDILEISLNDLEMKKFLELKEIDIKKKLFKILRNNDNISKITRIKLLYQLEKAHNVLEISDFEFPIDYNNEEFYICIVIKSGITFKKSVGYDKIMGQIVRPFIEFESKNPLVILLTVKPCSMDLMNKIMKGYSEFPEYVEVIQYKNFAKLLKIYGVL